jgi:hypothetical protein
MNKANSAELNVISNFHSLHFFVGHDLMLPNSFEKKIGKFPVPTR